MRRGNGIIRIILAIGLGILTSSILAILIVNIVPYYISEYLPVFVGAIVGSLILKNSPILIGGVISIFMIGVSIINLVIISYGISHLIQVPPLDFKIFFSLILYIPFGLLGGCCASIVNSFFRK
jgi:hypothetical protein